MSLFPGIKVDGHGYKEGLDPNGGSLQSVIEKNIFVEADRGQPFRKKLAAVLARIRTPIPMPRLQPVSHCSPSPAALPAVLHQPATIDSLTGNQAQD